MISASSPINVSSFFLRVTFSRESRSTFQDVSSRAALICPRMRLVDTFTSWNLISTFFQWLTLCSNDGNLEERSRSPQLHSCEEVHPLILCLLQQGVYPAMVPSHAPQRLQVTHHRTYHTWRHVDCIGPHYSKDLKLDQILTDSCENLDIYSLNVKACGLS